MVPAPAGNAPPSRARKPDGWLELLFHRETLELLWVHIFGEDAAELLHIGQAVFTLKGKVTYFVNTVLNYPTLAECYKAAAFNGLNRLSQNYCSAILAESCANFL